VDSSLGAKIGRSGNASIVDARLRFSFCSATTGPSHRTSLILRNRENLAGVALENAQHPQSTSQGKKTAAMADGFRPRQP